MTKGNSKGNFIDFLSKSSMDLKRGEKETRPSFRDVVSGIFFTWRKASIEFVVLRNYLELPDFVGNDLDILISSRQKILAEALLREVVISLGYKFYNRVEFSCTAVFLSKGVAHSLHIDLFSHLTWRGFTLLPSTSILSSRRKFGLFDIPHPVHEGILNLLTRLLYHGYVRDKYKWDIVGTFSGNPEMTLALLGKLFGAPLANRLLQDVLDLKWDEIQSYASALRKALVMRAVSRSPIKCVSAFCQDFVRLVRRVVAPPGIFIVLMGPDGCGKSTLASRLIEEMGPKFFRDIGQYIHWKPKILGPQSDHLSQPCTTPHLKKPRNFLLSIVYFLIHWITFVIGSNIRIRPIVSKNGMVVADRYYYDFYVDPKRYRLTIPRVFIRVGEALFFKPDVIICLDADSRLLQSRKSEVTLAETERQREAYRTLVDSMKNGHIVDASMPINQVEARVRRIVLDNMVERLRIRAGDQWGTE